jgi:hypothetical protein
MTDNNQVQFEFEGKKFNVVRPSNKIRKESNIVYNKALREAIDSGFFFEFEIEELLKDRGYNEKDYNKQRNDMMKGIRAYEAKLINEQYKNLDEGKQIAFKTQDLRAELENFDSPHRELRSQSATTFAENKRFNFFAYKCISTEDGSQIWTNFDEYENDDSQLAIMASAKLLYLLYQVNHESSQKISAERTENVWLKQNKFMNEDLQLINTKGQTIDREGRLIDKEGNFINESGDRIDVLGNPLDAEGKLIPNKPKTPDVLKEYAQTLIQ